MKRPTQILLTAFAIGAVQIASAFNYSPKDLILVFRESGHNDVEIDIGSVTNFIGLAPGTKVPVSYPAGISTNFNNTMSGVDFVLVAATAIGDTTPRVWATDVNLFSTPGLMTPSQFSLVRGKIENVGVKATAVTGGIGATFIDGPSDNNSYSKIVSGGTGNFVSTLGGDSDYPVETLNPTTMPFYQEQIGFSGTATMIGAFTMDVNGSLYFTAGQLPPLYSSTITGITSLFGSSTISFTTTNGVNYQRQYSIDLTSGNWSPVGGATTAGDNTIQNLFDFSTDPTRFYRIQSKY